MNDDDLLRYARHLLLDEIGFAGQQKLLAAHALVLGAGGLGSPVALYLASAGVGRITLVDDDVVDLGNLQRQIAHTQARIGQPKVLSAQAALAALNPQVRVTPVQRRADEALLRDLLAQADVAIDCSDNFAARQALNRACVALRKPLVAGAAVGFEGQVSVHDLRRPDAPCYACLFPPSQIVPERRCATTGVFAPLVGIIGSMQAAEALKLLCGAGQCLNGRLMLFDALRMHCTELALPPPAQCEVCQGASA